MDFVGISFSPLQLPCFSSERENQVTSHVTQYIHKQRDSGLGGIVDNTDLNFSSHRMKSWVG